MTSREANQSAGDIQNVQHIVELNMNDVLHGRGAIVDRFEGNKRFRALVRCKKMDYTLAHPTHKTAIAQGIVDSIRAAGGRFLRKSDPSPTAAPNKTDITTTESDGQKWIESDNITAVEKVKQAIRDCAWGDVPTEPTTNGGSSSSLVANASAAAARHETSSLSGLRSLHSTQQHTGQDSHIQSPAHNATAATNSETDLLPRVLARYNQIIQQEQQRRRQEDDASIIALIGEALASRAQHNLPHGIGPIEHNPHVAARTSPLVQGDSASIGTPLFFPATTTQHESLGTKRAVAQIYIQHQQQQIRRQQELQLQCRVLAINDLPELSVRSSIIDLVATSWKDLPAAYLRILPLMHQALGPPFTERDLEILLLTRARMEVVGDTVGLTQIHEVLRLALQLPTPQIRLSSRNQLASPNNNLLS